MLDIKYIREHPDKVKKAIENKKNRSDINIYDLISKYDELKAKTRELENIRNKRNKLNDQIRKTEDIGQKQSIIEQTTLIKSQVIELEKIVQELENVVNRNLLSIPNVISDDVPDGKDESENVVLRKWGEPKVVDFSPKNHYDLGLLLNVIDTETSAKVSGSRFNYLKNELVFLQFALIQFVLERLTNKGFIQKVSTQAGVNNEKIFTPIIPPVIAKAEVMKKMDRYDPADDRYYFEADDSLFVGSAEHTLGPMYMDYTFDPTELPVRLLGYSTAFRREAGTYGKDTVGIFRRHQFDKLEMEVFSTPETGLKEQDFLVGIQEALVQELNIPYEVVILCSGDMGKPDFRQIDINCWFPGQNAYRETHTSDYMTDYQSRRLNTKVKLETGDKSYVHMNDATAFAIGRTLVAIMENYQQKDNSVVIPEVLRKYTGFDVIKPKT